MREDPKSPSSASKRPAKPRSSPPSPRSSSTASSRTSVTAPAKAALAPARAMKDDSLPRKKSVKEYLRPSVHGKTNKHLPPTPTDVTANGSGNSNLPSPSSGAADDGGKHDRIAELEKALKDAQEEVSRFKQEMVLLKTKQGINPLLSREQSPSQGSRDVVDSEMEDISQRDNEDDDSDESFNGNELLELRSKLHDLESELLDQDNIWKARWERERAERIHERNSMAEELHFAQKEAFDRRKQLLELKQSLSSLTHRENQVTDGELAERMDGLYHRIREWVVSTLRRSQLDFSQLPELTKAKLASVIPTYMLLDPKVHKISIYQSIIMTSLMEMFDDPHCFGLPTEGPLSQIRAIADRLKKSSAEYRKWHSSTIELIINSANAELRDYTEVALANAATRTLNLLSMVSSTELPISSQRAFEGILNQAIQISRLFRVQVPEYTAYVPLARPFDPSIMELADEDDEDGIEQFPVTLVLSPCIQKISDESGLDTQPYTITKARVLCAHP